MNEPEFIREILVNQPQNFIKERTQRRMKILLGEGLITSDGEVHKRQRRIAAPAFHRQRIQAYGAMMVDRAATMRATWTEGVGDRRCCRDDAAHAAGGGAHPLRLPT